MIYRAATPGDVPALISIFRSARATAMPWLPVLHTAEDDLKFFTNRILPSYDVTVAQQEDRVIAFIATEADWIEQLYIDPAHWREGIGSNLLRRAMAGAAFWQLWVFARNLNAQAFYAKHGFQVAERTDGRNNEEKCPDLRLEWRA